MSVAFYEPNEIKSLEHAVRRVVSLDQDHNPFAALFVGTREAYSRSYDDRRPLSEQECQAYLEEYRDAVTGSHHENDTLEALLNALHLLQYNLYTNGGEYCIDNVLEQQRRMVMQRFVDEMLYQGGPVIKVDDHLYVRRLDDIGIGNVRRIQFLTSCEPDVPYQGQSKYINQLAKIGHGRIWFDLSYVKGFSWAWKLHDQISEQAQREYEASILEQLKKWECKKSNQVRIA